MHYRYRYRNRPLFAVAVAFTLLLAGAAAYLLFLDSGLPAGPWQVVLALAVPCAAGWVAVRAALTPYVALADGALVVRNPFVLYLIPLDRVRMAPGRGGLLDVEGIGVVGVWALSRSVFDGARAKAGRKAVRAAVAKGAGGAAGGSGAATRRVVFGWYDVLVLPFLGAVGWAFLP